MLSASVEVDGQLVSSIGPGLLCLVGVAADDAAADAEWLARKLLKARAFPAGEERGWDRDVRRAGGGAGRGLAALGRGARAARGGAARRPLCGCSLRGRGKGARVGQRPEARAQGASVAWGGGSGGGAVVGLRCARHHSCRPPTTCEAAPCRLRALAQVAGAGGELLLVSQFTLHARFKKPKPDFRCERGCPNAAPKAVLCGWQRARPARGGTRMRAPHTRGAW